MRRGFQSNDECRQLLKNGRPFKRDSWPQYVYRLEEAEIFMGVRMYHLVVNDSVLHDAYVFFFKDYMRQQEWTNSGHSENADIFYAEINFNYE